ncbi:MAG: 4Fe-4S dicluster domain-containing protein [Bacteroidales bacterium]|nr:4Fe-4S binding protein [Bacteroidales bacterium]
MRNKKILIDLTKLRDHRITGRGDKPRLDGILSTYPNTNGLKTIRELAVFRFTCRRCEQAPCIDVCPAEALEKDDEGMIVRHTNLCIACKSCVTICPFGTMMTDFFEHIRNPENYFDLNNERELKQFLEFNPGGVVKLVDMEENEEENIYQLNDQVLVKDIPYEKLKNQNNG